MFDERKEYTRRHVNIEREEARQHILRYLFTSNTLHEINDNGGGDNEELNSNINSSNNSMNSSINKV